MFDPAMMRLTLAQTDALPGGDNGGLPAGNGDGGGGAGGNGQPGGAIEGADGGNGDSALLDDGTRTGEEGGGSVGTGLGPILPILILVMLAFLVMSIFSQRKEKKRRQQMLDDLKKNDKVVTIGGIVGTIVELRDNEVILKVDESSNTRMHFTRNAIQGPVSESNDDAAEEKK